MPLLYQIPVFYVLIINLIGLAVMGIDKKKAKAHTWRISEKTLFTVSLFGGSLGTLCGMYLFHHKTRHWYFVVGMPLILFIQIAAALYLFHTYI